MKTRPTIAAALSGLTLSLLAAAPALAVVGGTDPVTDGIDPLPAVAQIHSDNGSVENCTGTLISQTWVITAAHCMYSGQDHIGTQYRPEQVEINFREGPENYAYTLSPDEIHIMPGYVGTTTATDDVALLHLSETADGIAPVPVLDGSVAATMAEVERWGFGKTDLKCGTAHVTGIFDGDCVPKHVRMSAEAVDATDDRLLRTRPIRGGTSEGDSGGATLVRFPSGGVALAGVTEGSTDLSGNSSRNPKSPNFRGLSNRVDTASPAWDFITEHVADWTTAS